MLILVIQSGQTKSNLLEQLRILTLCCNQDIYFIDQRLSQKNHLIDNSNELNGA
jgi:hypothetical protein